MTEDDKKKDPGAPQAPKGKLNIKINDDVAKGIYANLGIVHNNDAEFIFDFVFVEPQRAQGQVVSRVVANPRTVKRLLLGLTDMIRIYEERRGKIELPEPIPPKGNYH